MTDSIAYPEPAVQPAQGDRTWRDYAGAWLGIGTSPGALLLGAEIARRHGGPMPLLSILLSLTLMFSILWFQGLLGVSPPFGEGANLTSLTPRYFGRSMQRVVGALIALGMIGWFGFNAALGAAAFSALVGLPHWVWSLVLGLSVLALSLKGIQGWSGLAAVTTISVLVLTVMVGYRLAARALPFRVSPGNPLDMMTDVAVLVGYVSVFSVRAPDFSARLPDRRSLAALVLLLCLPVMGIVLAGVGLEQGTGSVDLVRILAGPDGLAIGNLLITLSVIAPTFTTLYSGAPALKAALGLKPRPALILITIVGLVLAVARFDRWLGSWLSLLAALLPPFVVPLAAESIRRRRGSPARLIPLWTWLPGSMVALALTALEIRLALLVGLSVAGALSALWSLRSRGVPLAQAGPAEVEKPGTGVLRSEDR